MSSACVCHIEGAWCFYCEVYSPVAAENERLQAEVKRIIFDAESESRRAESATLEALTYAAEIEQLRAEVKALTLTADAAGWEIVGYEEENEGLTAALHEIDTHIRATSDPIPHIVATLKRVLPEYAEEDGDPFADETEVTTHGSTQESGE